MCKLLASLSNEKNEVLNCVFTNTEAIEDLCELCTGVEKRYKDAGADAPQVLYVDCNCCSKCTEGGSSGESPLLKLFPTWIDTALKLDIWHWLDRFKHGCTSDSHIAFPIFMRKLSTAIWEWDNADMELFLDAKGAELAQRGFLPSDIKTETILKHSTLKELHTYVKKTTKSADDIISAVDQILQDMTTTKDSAGQYLFTSEMKVTYTTIL